MTHFHLPPKHKTGGSSKQLSVSISRGLYDDLAAEAQAKGVTLKRLVAGILEDHLRGK